jgi:dihydroflavonol-4-reductase
MSRFWVGGATGFLGSHIVRGLADAGHEVVAVSRGGGAVAGHQVARVDVTDPAAVKASASGCDGAFFAVGRVSRSKDDAREIHEANVVAARSGLDGLRAAGIPRVVFASTSGTIACGTDPNRCYTEDGPTPHEQISRWPYYRAKLFAERVALEMNEPGRFEVVVVNPSLLLGPGDQRASSTLDVRRFLAGSLPAVAQGGMAFVDVRDAAAAMIAAFELGRPGERYLVSGANMTVPVFFGRLSRLSGRPMPSLRLPKSPSLALASHWLYGKALSALGASTPVEPESVDIGSHFWYCDSSKAERELGFIPRDAQETLRDTLADIVGQPARGAAAPAAFPRV